MAESPPNAPFADLPAALVEEILQHTAEVARELLASITIVRTQRGTLRNQLVQSNTIISDSSLEYPPPPTTCGADGSYAIERLLTTDLAACAAVAVEGLTPPSEKRHWDLPHHSAHVWPEPHHEDTATVLRAVMLGEELRLATSAPHDLVLLDGTLTLPTIYFNQALSKSAEAARLHCSKEFIGSATQYFQCYLEILQSQRSDKQYVALPKYSTRRELGVKFSWPEGYDDRGILTLLLDAGEFTRPSPLEQPSQDWHFNTNSMPSPVRERLNEIAPQVIATLHRIQILYYKPHDWLPALRLEIAEAIASNPHRLAIALHGIKYQCATPSMLEPYPLYLADRTVKALARGVPAFRQVTTQRLSEQYEGDMGEVFFAMHGYRSEIGR